jgi:phage FluMu protein Com
VIDLRCDGAFKGIHFGGVCGQLILRYSTDLAGDFEVKCGRCKRVKTYRIRAPIVAYST